MWRASENLEIKLLEFRINGDRALVEKQNGFCWVSDAVLDALVSSFERDEGWKSVGDGKVGLLGDSGLSLSFASARGSHCTIRLYPSLCLLAVEIHELRELGQTLFQSSEAISNFIAAICKHFDATTLRNVTSVPRVSSAPRLFFGSMQQLFVYDFDRVVLDADSPHQNIKILHSPSLGNTLVLDDYINLSERDAAYTECLMNKGEVDYSGKEVLILGGGDGALLNQVLKERPKFVTMIELDDMVVEACRKHMRSLCENSLDTYKSEIHEILIADCFCVLSQYQEEGRCFDAVFADLTDTPLITDGEKKMREFWTLMEKVLRASLDVLKPGGHFMTHLVGVTNQAMIKDYEKLLNSFQLKYQRSTAMVPSFYEEWVFYQVDK